MQNYLKLMRRILRDGIDRPSRPGINTRSLFGEQLKFDLSAGFPLVTTRRIHFKSVIVELLWMLSGDTNVRSLQAQGVTIWDEWADEHGNLGPIYGHQWRYWPSRCGRTIDQITQLRNSLADNPESRRHILTAWNPGDLSDMALPPCHCLAQFYIARNKLSCHLYQRSADYFLGVPYNIASYATLTQILAHDVGLDLGHLIISYGDVHLYHNHFDAAKLQLKRTPRSLPVLHGPGNVGLSHRLTIHDLTLALYDPHPHIPAPIAV